MRRRVKLKEAENKGEGENEKGETMNSRKVG